MRRCCTARLRLEERLPALQRAWRVFHKLDRSLRCHHCGLARPCRAPAPTCGNLDIAPIGRGTERLEERVAELLPGAPRVARIDADATTRARAQLRPQLGPVHAGAVDILVGTQMIAMGHDFRRITLVAAVNPDSALFSSDFRAPSDCSPCSCGRPAGQTRDALSTLRAVDVDPDLAPRCTLYAALRAARLRGVRGDQLTNASAGPAAVHPPRAAPRRGTHRRGWQTAGSSTPLPRLAHDVALAADGVTLWLAGARGRGRVANVERMQMLVESVSRTALQRMLAAWLPQLHALRQPPPPSHERIPALGDRRRPAGDLSGGGGRNPAA